MRNGNFNHEETLDKTGYHVNPIRFVDGGIKVAIKLNPDYPLHLHESQQLAMVTTARVLLEFVAAQLDDSGSACKTCDSHRYRNWTEHRQRVALDSAMSKLDAVSDGIRQQFEFPKTDDPDNPERRG